MVDLSARGEQLHALADLARSGHGPVAQRQALRNLFGPAAQLKDPGPDAAPAQLMTGDQYRAVVAWQAEHGLSISDYGYNPRTNLIVYYSQIGTDGRVEIHVHLDGSGRARPVAANIRILGDGPPGIGLIGTTTGDIIVSECLSYWFPEIAELHDTQGAEL